MSFGLERVGWKDGKVKVELGKAGGAPEKAQLEYFETAGGGEGGLTLDQAMPARWYDLHEVRLSPWTMMMMAELRNEGQLAADEARIV